MTYDDWGNNVLFYYTLMINKTNTVTPVWTESTPKDINTLICFTVGAVVYKFYYDGQYWQRYIGIIALSDVGTSITVTGYAMPNTWVQVQISLDGVTYVNKGSPTPSATFQAEGVACTGLTTGLTYYFRYYEYDNNCNYGYSGVETAVKL